MIVIQNGKMKICINGNLVIDHHVFANEKLAVYTFACKLKLLKQKVDQLYTHVDIS